MLNGSQGFKVLEGWTISVTICTFPRLLVPVGLHGAELRPENNVSMHYRYCRGLVVLNFPIWLKHVACINFKNESFVKSHGPRGCLQLPGIKDLAWLVTVRVKQYFFNNDTIHDPDRLQFSNQTMAPHHVFAFEHKHTRWIRSKIWIGPYNSPFTKVDFRIRLTCFWGGHLGEVCGTVWEGLGELLGHVWEVSGAMSRGSYIVYRTCIGGANV